MQHRTKSGTGNVPDSQPCAFLRFYIHEESPLWIVVSSADFFENNNGKIGTTAKTIAAALQTKSTYPEPFINPQTTELQSLNML